MATCYFVSKVSPSLPLSKSETYSFQMFFKNVSKICVTLDKNRNYNANKCAIMESKNSANCIVDNILKSGSYSKKQLDKVFD